MTARLANTKICDAGYCELGDLLVRGDRISFVSLEQIDKVGHHKLDPVAMPSDVVLPESYVLVHDPGGTLLSKCDLYVVKWRSTAKNRATIVRPELMRTARAYFGSNSHITRGTVDIPKGRWQRVAKVQFIRYRREGDDNNNYEHEYDVPVDLMYCRTPLAWRLPLPEGCIVNARGFVRP